MGLYILITLWGSTYAKFVCSIILKHPVIISGCCLMEFIRHTHLILECNSSLIWICFLIMFNIISQKPPFFNSFSQKSPTPKSWNKIFVFINFFIVLKLSCIKTFKKFDENCLWCQRSSYLQLFGSHND